jgi:hypothetical protein
LLVTPLPLLQGYERQNGEENERGYDKSPKSLPPYSGMGKMEGIAGKCFSRN